jgi:hypothetical protein
MDIKKKRGIIIVVSTVVLLLAISFTLRPTECQDFWCFKGNMEKCSPATYINDDLEATWRYEVVGSSKDRCEVEVTLLMMKEGELSTARLEGKSMSCNYPMGISAYPERNLEMCNGILKEEIQKMIIEKLHGYVLSNLDDIRQSLRD